MVKKFIKIISLQLVLLILNEKSNYSKLKK